MFKSSWLKRTVLCSAAFLFSFGCLRICMNATWRPLTPERAVEEIRLGMTKDQVMDIIRLAPGEYAEPPPTNGISSTGKALPRPSNCLEWTFYEGEISIWFERGKVTGKTYSGYHRTYT